MELSVSTLDVPLKLMAASLFQMLKYCSATPSPNALFASLYLQGTQLEICVPRLKVIRYRAALVWEVSFEILLALILKLTQVCLRLDPILQEKLRLLPVALR